MGDSRVRHLFCGLVRLLEQPHSRPATSSPYSDFHWSLRVASPFGSQSIARPVESVLPSSASSASSNLSSKASTPASARVCRQWDRVHSLVELGRTEKPAALHICSDLDAILSFEPTSPNPSEPCISPSLIPEYTFGATKPAVNLEENLIGKDNNRKENSQSTPRGDANPAERITQLDLQDLWNSYPYQQSNLNHLDSLSGLVLVGPYFHISSFFNFYYWIFFISLILSWCKFVHFRILCQHFYGFSIVKSTVSIFLIESVTHLSFSSRNMTCCPSTFYWMFRILSILRCWIPQYCLNVLDGLPIRINRIF